MKKIFSLFAAVLFAGSMMATEVTFTKDDFAGQGTANTGSEVSATKGGVTFTYSKGYCADESLRCYAHGSLSITAETTIEKINFTTTGGKTGGLDAEVTVGATSYSVDDLASQARFTQIVVTLEGGEPVVEDTYTVAGAPEEIFGAYWNPEFADNDMKKVGGIYTWEKAELELAPNDKIEFKVVKNHDWNVAAFPASNFEISADEEGVYTLKITFDPTTEVVEAVLEGAEVLADPTNCAEAAEAALSVSANNELYNDGKEYTIEGYVTSIKTAYSDQYHNISFWMADTKEGGEVLQAYRAACETEADAPQVGDKVAVTGSLTKYGTTPEFAAGCTVVIIERAEPVTPSEFGVLGVAEAIALAAEGKLKDDDILSVKGIITKIEFKGKNFAKFGSVNIYVADATGEEGEFEFYNCYSLEADTFRTSVPEYDPENASWAQFDEVTDGNNVTVKVGDVVIAKGKYKLYNTTHELNTGCFLTDINPTGEGIEETATDAKAVKVVRNGQVYILRGDKTFNLIGAEVK